MEKQKKFRALALFLSVTLLISVLLPSVFADNGDTDASSTDTLIIEEPTLDKVMESDVDVSEYGKYESEDGQPLSDDGEPLSRRQFVFFSAASAAITKSTCVTFPAYTSSSWHCHRYEVDGTHAYGHYYYAAEIAYHTIDGQYSYCIEPNTSSIGGATYTSYSANSASSSSYWMYELDATQRSYIQKILAFGYPSCDYGYSVQAQYAATQILIWEVVAKQRYASISEASDYGLYYAVKNTLGNDLYYPYMAIVDAIANSVSNGNVPSFSSTSSTNPSTITLSLNSATNCYEATVTDSNAVLSHFNFAYSGVTFAKSGSSLKISVPADSITSVTGKTITGTSDQKNMSTSNPTIWENGTYQTVLSAGGAENMKAYIKLAATITPPTITPTPTVTPTPTPTPTPEPEPQYWYAVVSKVDAETGAAQGDATLDGAEYTLYKSGRAVKTYTIRNGCFTTDEYLCTASNGIYTLKETKAAPGYQLDTTVYKLDTSESSYSSTLNRISLSVPEQVIKDRITLSKQAVNTVSGKSQPEKGAVFEVWLKSAGSYAKAKSTERDTITIGTDGTGSSKELPYGVYCVKQTKTWDGHDIDTATYEVSVPDTSNAGPLALENDIWTGRLTIHKIDGDTKEPLANAQFSLTGSDGSKQVLATGGDGIVFFDNLVYGVTYTWQEIKAPKGYLLNEDTGTWSVLGHDDSIEITCEDYRRPGAMVITKQDMDGNPLSGCTLLLEYLDGSQWKPVTARSADTAVSKGGCTSEGLLDGTLTTDETGVVAFEGLWADDELQYRLTEIAAPEGCELLSEPIYEGVLPIGYKEGEVSAEPDECINGTSYFYTLPITVRDGHVYKLPMTGGHGFPFIPIGVALSLFGAAAVFHYKYPCYFRYLKNRMKRRNFS